MTLWHFCLQVMFFKNLRYAIWAHWYNNYFDYISNSYDFSRVYKKGNIANNNEKVQMIITIIIFSLQERRCWQNWVVFLCHNLEQCCICTITDVKMLMFLMLIFCVAKFIQTHTNHCILFRSYIKLMSVQGKFLHCIYANMQTWIQQKLKHTN